MGLIDLSADTPVSGGDGDANQIANAFNTIQSTVNGDIDDANVASDAAIAATKLAAVPCARVYNSGNIAVANNTETALTFDTERYDTDTIHSTSANTGRLTATTAGVYTISGTVLFAANSTGYRKLLIRLNGSSFLAGQEAPSNAASNPSFLSVSTEFKLAATDYVELIAYQNSGGSLNVTAAGNYSPEFAMTRLSA